MYTHVDGDEYEDISAAWDWDHIPGITIDYKETPLSCAITTQYGLENFVGGVSTGQVGAAAMRYTNPLTRALHWQKAWFFLEDDIQHVMIAGISSSSSASVFSVLDQRRHTGEVRSSRPVDGIGGEGRLIQGGQALWHGDVGYVLPSANSSAQLHA